MVWIDVSAEIDHISEIVNFTSGMIRNNSCDRYKVVTVRKNIGVAGYF